MTYPSGKDALEAIYRKLQERAHQEVKMEQEKEKQEKQEREKQEKQEKQEKMIVFFVCYLTI